MLTSPCHDVPQQPPFVYLVTHLSIMTCPLAANQNRGGNLVNTAVTTNRNTLQLKLCIHECDNCCTMAENTIFAHCFLM